MYNISLKLSKKILNFIIYIPIIFLFLQSFYIPGTNIPFYDIIIGITIVFLLLIRPQIFIQFFKIKHSYYKILWLYIIWLIFSGLFLVINGTYDFNKYLYGVFVLFFYNNILWYIYPSILTPRFLSLKKLIRILLIAIYIVCLYGILIYLFDKINFPILEPLHNLIVNRREMISSTRVLSFFEEPGYLGGFICINIPIVYNVILTRFKILKNNKINKIFKLTFIPLYITTIILVQSPIWIIVFFVINIIYFRKFILKHIKMFLIIFFIFILTLNVAYKLNIKSNVTNSRGVITRLSTFINNFGTNIIYIDESLATRIIGYQARLELCFKYPFTGVGYKNAENHVFSIFSTEKYILTTELREKMYSATSNNKYIVVSGAILWNALSDTGIIGAFLYYLFVILSILKLNSIEKRLPFMLIRYFIQGLKQSYILILCLSIYDIRSNFIYFWFLFGMTIPCVHYYKQFNQKRNFYLMFKGEKNEY